MLLNPGCSPPPAAGSALRLHPPPEGLTRTPRGRPRGRSLPVTPSLHGGGSEMLVNPHGRLLPPRPDSPSFSQQGPRTRVDKGPRGECGAPGDHLTSPPHRRRSLFGNTPTPPPCSESWALPHPPWPSLPPEPWAHCRSAPGSVFRGGAGAPHPSVTPRPFPGTPNPGWTLRERRSVSGSQGWRVPSVAGTNSGSRVQEKR